MLENLPLILASLNPETVSVAKLLIEKVSLAVEGVAAPMQIKRIARAEAEADIIKAKGEVEASIIRAKGETEENVIRAYSEIEVRSILRLINESTRHQRNIENILATSFPKLKATANPSAMDDDWVTNFFDKCRNVSNGQMQQLWAKILAGEANNAGAFSNRTVSLLADLEKRDAEALALVCSYGVGDGNEIPIIFVQAPIYKLFGPKLWQSIQRLKGMGLLNFDLLGQIHTPCNDLPNKIMTVKYFGKQFKVSVPALQFRVGQVELTLV
jgi:hypothetical protein